MIDVIGMGEDGPAGLAPAARRRLEAAEFILASPRLQRRLAALSGQELPWPQPVTDAIPLLRRHADAATAAVVSGDPLWYSLGNLLAREFGPACRFHPQVSSFQLAACRLGWSMADTVCASLHGRPVATLAPLLAPGQRLLLLTADAGAPAEIAGYLVASGYGDTRMRVLAHLGGEREACRSGIARAWSGPAADLHVLALELGVAGPTPAPGRAPGLPDSAYSHDGQLTKQTVRAATLARLRPGPGALLWDLGCGCGSIAIEWVRGAPGARARGIDRAPERLDLARANAAALGAAACQWFEGDVADALAWPETPDAVFVGGGLNAALLDGAWSRLAPGGRLVANAVTWDSQQLLHQAQARRGGELVRIAVEQFGRLGGRAAWLPSMPVTQWSCSKFPPG